MPTRLHKNRKKRGHVSAGHGRVGKHRKHPGGRGNAGAEHHHRTNITRYHPDYLGKHGMRRFGVQKQRHYVGTINLEKLGTLIPEQSRDYFFQNLDSRPVLDLTRMNVHKVLGKGSLIAMPLVVRARAFSKKARARIEARGGVCQIVGEMAPGTQQSAA
eukprot:Protomagalhaensia_wolfi_Nauph_80__3225@NODE_3287_length_837_cov_1254_967419_g2578_i0_p1_GENE_NODE_3287_length_837_cov_1254_967419_g2578_i0NODE_3287_length_837_cov_1254_967419_g2578_i0_p1_ORF_typecomplete_len159_score22_87Ribosomal_L27A/PF00828_19/1_9e18Ribosomal_L18/PF17135_4/0_00042_NODE_3287_length_837_cov_1254_967419_g2578_i0284760